MGSSPSAHETAVRLYQKKNKDFLDKIKDLLPTSDRKGNNIVHYTVFFGTWELLEELYEEYETKTKELAKKRNTVPNTPIEIACQKYNPAKQNQECDKILQIFWKKQPELVQEYLSRRAPAILELLEKKKAEAESPKTAEAQQAESPKTAEAQQAESPKTVETQQAESPKTVEAQQAESPKTTQPITNNNSGETQFSIDLTSDPESSESQESRKKRDDTSPEIRYSFKINRSSPLRIQSSLTASYQGTQHNYELKNFTPEQQTGALSFLESTFSKTQNLPKEITSDDIECEMKANFNKNKNTKCAMNFIKNSVDESPEKIAFFAAKGLNENEIRVCEELKQIEGSEKYFLLYGAYHKKIALSHQKNLGSLISVLENDKVRNSIFEPKRICQLFHHISKGIEILHQNNLCHGDISLGNILAHRNLKNELEFYLCDFELSGKIDTEYKGKSKIVSFLENWNQSHTKGLDVFLLGKTICEFLFFNKSPVPPNWDTILPNISLEYKTLSTVAEECYKRSSIADIVKIFEASPELSSIE